MKICADKEREFYIFTEKLKGKCRIENASAMQPYTT